MTREPRIVVGVDGSDAALAAVRFGSTEARRTGCAMRLVHVMPETVPLVPMLPLISSETFAEAGGRVLRQARHEAERTAGRDLAVSTHLRSGARVHGIVAEGEDARMVVLGHRDRSGLGRILTGSTSTGVATRAHCEVVSVPDTWAPEHAGSGVVVGVDQLEHSGEVLAAAFEAAGTRGERLTVVHAWRLPSPYDDIIVERAQGDDWRAGVTRELAVAVAPFRSDHPDVEVELDVRHQFPTAALLGAAEGAALLVVGRRGPGAPFGFHLGGVARAMMTHAHCPVAVVPMRPRPGERLELDLVAGEVAPQP